MSESKICSRMLSRYSEGNWDVELYGGRRINYTQAFSLVVQQDLKWKHCSVGSKELLQL